MVQARSRRSWQRKPSGKVNETKIFKVLFELPKYIVTTDQIIPAEIVIEMPKWPGSNQIITYSRSINLIVVLTWLPRTMW